MKSQILDVIISEVKDAFETPAIRNRDTVRKLLEKYEEELIDEIMDEA
jgi:hypothetical protein